MWISAPSQLIESSQIIFAELYVEVIGNEPPQNMVLLHYSAGVPTGIQVALKRGDQVRLPIQILSDIITLIGVTQNNSKALIAINVNLSSDVVLNVYMVDESGSSGGGSDGNYRLAGTVKINSVAAQRDLIVISDNPSGREVVGEGESASDGAFDLNYSGWDGSVFVIAVDNYGSDFAESTPLNAGKVIHPTTPNGYVYVVTEAGTTGTTEPAWSTTSSVVSGSVTFAPREYYRPVGWGPQKGALVE